MELGTNLTLVCPMIITGSVVRVGDFVTLSLKTSYAHPKLVFKYVIRSPNQGTSNVLSA